jgi:hypothetical protein
MKINFKQNVMPFLKKTLNNKFYCSAAFVFLFLLNNFSQDCILKENSFDKTTNVTTLISDDVKIFGGLTDGATFSVKKIDKKYFILLNYEVTKGSGNISVSALPVMTKIAIGDKLIILLTNNQKISLTATEDVIMKSTKVPNINNVNTLKLSDVNYLISEEDLRSIEGSIITSISIEHKADGDDKITHTYANSKIKEKNAIKFNRLITCIFNN